MKTTDDVPVPTEEDPWLDTAAIAKLTCFKEATVRDWLTSKKLKGFRLQGEWRVQHSDFVKFLKEKYGD